MHWESSSTKLIFTKWKYASSLQQSLLERSENVEWFYRNEMAAPGYYYKDVCWLVDLPDEVICVEGQ